ncbi:MAG: flagellar hook-associated protein FlgK [Sedimentisphaerales bacterium]|nr:flagellar hook-associated protein FlgK [Sedimentisphaerales bacterium]
MALINGALQIGRSAITASQAALAVTGNNMANAATPSYSRQSVYLTPTQYTEVIPGKYTGTGVALYDIRRQVDDALNGRIRTAVGDSASSLIQQQALTRVEATFNELTESDLSSRMNDFFQAWSSLQNQPQDIASRSVVLQEGTGLTNFIREMYSEMRSVQLDLDAQVRFQVDQADALATEIAALNRQVVTAESGNAGSAAALRDQRDDLLKQLSELVNITTREVDGGAVNVFIGNDPLIQYSDNRGLEYVERQDSNGVALAQVVFSDNQQAIELTSGKVHGLITARDDKLGGIIAQVDDWTKSMIYEVNLRHSLGRGLDGFTAVSSFYTTDDPTASLADADATELPWAVTNGVFNLHVTDNSGNTITTQISVSVGMDSSDTTLNDLAAALDAVANINATVDTAGRLRIDSDSGFTFGFSGPEDASDATNALAVLGINTFFEGTNGNDIRVRSGLASNPRDLACSGNGLAGNGDIAADIAQLSTVGVESLNGLSLSDSFSALIGTIAADTKAAQDNYIAADVVLQTLEAERQSISGVSIDEEAINMIIFQRAFQGASRYINLINEMLDEVIALV